MHRNYPETSPILWWPPPLKYSQNLHNIQKYIHFSEKPKNIQIQNFEPPKKARAYVCVIISECPPLRGSTIQKKYSLLKKIGIQHQKIGIQDC